MGAIEIAQKVCERWKEHLDETGTLVAPTFKGQLRKGAQEGDRKAIRRVWRIPGEWGIKKDLLISPLVQILYFFHSVPRPSYPSQSLLFILGFFPFLPLSLPLPHPLSPFFSPFHRQYHPQELVLSRSPWHPSTFLLALLHFVVLKGGVLLN